MVKISIACVLCASASVVFGRDPALKAGTRASLGLYIHDRNTPADKDENGLSTST